MLKTAYEETEDEVEVHKFNSTICVFLTTPENAKKHVQKTLKLALEEAEREMEVRTR